LSGEREAPPVRDPNDADDLLEAEMIYEVVRANRYFDKDRQYSEIDWTNLDQVVDAFQKRIRDWYLDPAKELAKNGHFAFAVMALNRLLIDTLSQFAYGKDSSEANAFKQFIRDKLPHYSGTLSAIIQHNDGKRDTTLTDVADVLYHGFRCGILHQAHITPYGLVDPGANQPVRQETTGYVKYKGSGSDCPAVVVNPLRLLEDLAKVFDGYLKDLKDRDPKHNQLRANFKDKFSKSFGVDVS
jgi:hypothetical protein